MENMIRSLIGGAIDLDNSFALSEDMKLLDIPKMDSLGLVRLVMAIEKRIGDRLNLDEVVAMESVGSIRCVLQARGKLCDEP